MHGHHEKRVDVEIRGVHAAAADGVLPLQTLRLRTKEAVNDAIGAAYCGGRVVELAEMATKIEAARLMTRKAALMKDAGERSDLEAGMAKLFASETGKECVEERFRIHGGYGYSKEYEIERLYRDAPLLLIGEGTSEIQKMVIGKKLLQRHKI